MPHRFNSARKDEDGKEMRRKEEGSESESLEGLYTQDSRGEGSVYHSMHTLVMTEAKGIEK